MEHQTHTPTALLLGGDGRVCYAEEALIKAGCRTALYAHTGKPAFPCQPIDADLLILPLPLTRDGETLNAPHSAAPVPLLALLSLLHKGQTVVGGLFPPQWAEEFAKRGVRICDPLGDEAFAAANALSTAEGAIALAIAETPDLLYGCTCGILGYGRIAKQLAPRLAALGARLTVYARSAAAREEAMTRRYAAKALTELQDGEHFPDLLFNTIPHRLFDWGKLLPEGAKVIDLAPIYPADGNRVIRGAALPSVYSPRFAGNLLGQWAYARLQEQEGEQ